MSWLFKCKNVYKIHLALHLHVQAKPRHVVFTINGDADQHALKQPVGHDHTVLVYMNTHSITYFKTSNSQIEVENIRDIDISKNSA